MRCATKLLLLGVALVAAAAGAFWLGLPQKGMVVLIRAALAKRYSGQIEIAGLEIRNPRRVVVRGLALRDGAGTRSFLEVAEVDVELALTRFFSGMAAVDGLTLRSPRLDLGRDESGALAVTRYLVARTPRPRKTEGAGTAEKKDEGGGGTTEGAKPTPADEDPGLGIVIHDGAVSYRHPRVPLIRSLDRLELSMRRRPGLLRIASCTASIPMPLGLRVPVSLHDVTIDLDDPRRSEGISERARVLLYLFRELFELLGR